MVPFPGRRILEYQIETTPEVEAAYAACEERLTRHRGHVLDRARGLQNLERRRAFFAAYLSLRVAAPALLPRPFGRSRSRERSVEAIAAWCDAAGRCQRGNPDPGDPTQIALADAMARFQITTQPWSDLARGLAALAGGDPVPDVITFLHRARCLALPPAGVFFRILCSRRGVRRYRFAREVDVEELAHDPAVFAYFVGVMCDVFSELEHLGTTSIPRELLDRHGLTPGDLAAMCDGETPEPSFAQLMQDMALFAWTFYESGVTKITQAAASLSPEIIAELDGFLDHYKGALRSLEEAGFAPVRFKTLAGGLEPRRLGGTERVGPGESLSR